MKRIYLTITFVISLFVGIITPTYAQEDGALVPESNYNGHGVVLTDIKFPDNVSERVVFYNIGKKKFLNTGGQWGTRAATHTTGLSVQLEKNSKGTNKFYMKSPYHGMGGYVGYIGDSSDKNKNGVYFDRTKDAYSPKTASVFTFTKVDVSSISDEIKEKYGITTEDNIYRIQLLKADNKVYDNSTSADAISFDANLTANKAMHVNVFASGNTNLVDVQETTDTSSPEYTYWKIVNLEEIENTLLTDINIYNTEPADITFLIRAQNFNRQNIYNNDGQTPSDGRGWFYILENSSLYTTKFDDKDYTIDDYDFNDETHGDVKYGMFYCAQIRNSGSYVVKKGNRLYQTVPVTRAGWYRIDCQGFFYNGEGNTENCCAELFAYSNEGTEATRGTAEYAYVNFLPQRYLAKYPREIAEHMTDDNKTDLNAKLSDLKKGNAPKTHLEAGVAFYTNEYPNSVIVYVPTASKENPGSITFGIAATRDFADNDVVWADNFNLKYLGQSFALDERNSLTSLLTDKNNNKVEYLNRPMVLRRTLNKGKWNPIVLPVNLTKAQVNTTFFPLPLIAEFKGFKDANTLLFKIIDLTDPDKFPNENTVAMEAGHCYLINSGYEGHSGSIKIGDADGKTMRGPYYVIDRVTYTEEPEINTYVEAPTWGNTACKLSLVGRYEPDWVPQNSFLMDNSTLWHINDTYMARGYSWWIEDKHQKDNPAQAHLFSFSSMDSEYDEVTGLYEIKISDGSHSHHNGKVYNLQGIEMNGNAALPKGIYISNGKKFIVK